MLGDRKSFIVVISIYFSTNPALISGSREDKADHAELATRLALHTGRPIAVPNYRLTPRAPTPGTELRHPAHTEDILLALNFLNSPPNSFHSLRRDIMDAFVELYLIGHSCSAHMLSSIFLDSSDVTPSLTPSPMILSSTRAIVMSEGIYDLDLLVEKFPQYESGKQGFIGNAFGDRSRRRKRRSLLPWNFGRKKRVYEDVSTNFYPSRTNSGHIRWFIIHSDGDTLVDKPQSQVMLKHLESEFPSSHVRHDFETISVEHNDMLKTELYSSLVGDFMNGVLSKSMHAIE